MCVVCEQIEAEHSWNTKLFTDVHQLYLNTAQTLILKYLYDIYFSYMSFIWIKF